MSPQVALCATILSTSSSRLASTGGCAAASAGDRAFGPNSVAHSRPGKRPLIHDVLARRSDVLASRTRDRSTR